MTVKSLVAAMFCVALGCTSGSPPPKPVVVARAPAKPQPPPRRDETAQSAAAMTQTESLVVHRTDSGGIGITGPERPYLDRVDPSGWSGVSPAASEPSALDDPGLGEPTAIGGGPTAAADEDASADAGADAATDASADATLETSADAPPNEPGEAGD